MAARTQSLHRNEMWDLEVLVRDSGKSVVFAGYSSKKRDSW